MNYIIKHTRVMGRPPLYYLGLGNWSENLQEAKVYKDKNKAEKIAKELKKGMWKMCTVKVIKINLEETR